MVWIIWTAAEIEKWYGSIDIVAVSMDANNLAHFGQFNAIRGTRCSDKVVSVSLLSLDKLKSQRYW